MVQENKLKIVFGEEFSSEEKAAVAKRLKKLFTTPKGTMPMARDYGIDFSEIIDLPPPVAKNTYVVAAAEAINEYEPEFDIDGIDFDEVDNETGQFRDIVTLVPSSDDDE